MASRECGTVGVLVMLLLCVASAHRLFPSDREGGLSLSEAHSSHIQPGPDSTYKSTRLFQKPAGEPMDVDGHFRGLFEVSGLKLLGRIPRAEDNAIPEATPPVEVHAIPEAPPPPDEVHAFIEAPTPPDEVHAIPEAPTPPDEVHAFPEAPTPPDEVHAFPEAPTPPDEVHAFPEAPPPDEVHAIDQEEDFFGDFTNPDPEFI